MIDGELEKWRIDRVRRVGGGRLRKVNRFHETLENVRRVPVNAAAPSSTV